MLSTRRLRRNYIVLCNRQSADAASREGARFGGQNSLHPSSAADIIQAVQAVIDESAGGGLTLTANNVVIEGLHAAGGAPTRVIVRELRQ